MSINESRQRRATAWLCAAPKSLLHRYVCAVVACGLSVAALAAHAQEWPSKPIRVIVPYAPGGTDTQIRLLAPQLQRLLGQPLVIENKAGGGGSVGTAFVKTSPADGHTLLYTGTGVLTVVPAMQPLSYSADDFVPIGNVIGTPYVVAASSAGSLKTLAALVAQAKARPGTVTFGSAGQGTATHMAGEALALAAGITLVHVPYQGIAPAVTSILGGNIDLVVGLPSAIMPHVSAGKLIALATTGAERIDILKDIPTLRESGINVVDVSKFGLFAPKGTPDAVVQKLTAALREAVGVPEFADATRKTYNNVMYLDPAQFRGTVDADLVHFRKLIGTLKLGGVN